MKILWPVANSNQIYIESGQFYERNDVKLLKLKFSAMHAHLLFAWNSTWSVLMPTKTTSRIRMEWLTSVSVVNVILDHSLLRGCTNLSDFG